MKKGFTIIEVSILFVVFLIVAFLVAPFSLDDTLQAKNTSRWRSVQTDFANIFSAIDTLRENPDAKTDFEEIFNPVLYNSIKGHVKPYRITYMNGASPSYKYLFDDYMITNTNSVIAVNLFTVPENNIYGRLMYDVNGQTGPNVWGKDVFGYNIYYDRFEPFCKNDSTDVQKRECSSSGSGVCCSNYYLIGGSFD